MKITIFHVSMFKSISVTNNMALFSMIERQILNSTQYYYNCSSKLTEHIFMWSWPCSLYDALAWGHLLWNLVNLVIRYQSSGYLVLEGCEIVLRKCQSSCVVMVISFLASASQWMILQLFPSAREKICTEVYGILTFGEEFFVLKFTDHVYTMVPGDTVAPCTPPWFIQIYGL